MDCLFYYFVLKVLYMFWMQILYLIYVLQIFSLSLLFHFCFLFLFILYRTCINSTWYDAMWYDVWWYTLFTLPTEFLSPLHSYPSLFCLLVFFFPPVVAVGSNQSFSPLATLGVLFPSVVGIRYPKSNEGVYVDWGSTNLIISNWNTQVVGMESEDLTPGLQLFPN